MEQLEFNFIKNMPKLIYIQNLYPKELKDLVFSDCPLELKQNIEKMFLENTEYTQIVVKFIWLYGIKKFKSFMEKSKWEKTYNG